MKKILAFLFLTIAICGASQTVTVNIGQLGGACTNQFTNASTLNNLPASAYVTGFSTNVMVMGLCTNTQIYLNSNILVIVMGTNLYNGQYTNVTPLGSGFCLWHELGGSNYLTQNNPQWNSDESSAYCLTLGIQTNADSDANLIGIDQNLEEGVTGGGINQSNVFTIPLNWGSMVSSAIVPFAVVIIYGAPVVNNSQPSNACTSLNPHDFFVASKWGSDLNNGRTREQAFLTTAVCAAFFATNSGDVIHVQPGYYYGANLSSNVSLIGSGQNSNVCFISAVTTAGGSQTLANFCTEGISGPNNIGPGQEYIAEDLHIDGSEPFFVGGYILGGFTEFLRCEIGGQATINDAYSNILISGCTFFQSKFGSHQAAGLQVDGGATAEIVDTRFISGTNNVGGQNWLVGQDGGQGSGTILWGNGNSFNTNAMPCATITNCTVIYLTQNNAALSPGGLTGGGTFNNVDIPTNALGTHGYSGYFTNGVFVPTGTY